MADAAPGRGPLARDLLSPASMSATRKHEVAAGVTVILVTVGVILTYLLAGV